MDAPFLLLLLVVSGGAAAAGDDDGGQTRLEFRGIVDSGRGHAFDAPEEPAFTEAISADSDEASRLVFRGIVDSGRGHASDAPEEPAFTEAISADSDEASRLEFRGIVDSGRGHASDAPEEPAFIEAISADSDEASRLEFRGTGTDHPGRAHASGAPEEPAFIEAISADGACRRFARLVAETGNASQVFLDRVAAGGGLTLFCPEDKALAEFEPKFRTFHADDQLTILLYHGTAARYGREQFRAFDWVSVKTLAADAATNKSHAITVRDDGNTVQLWPLCRSGDAARVTKTVSEEPTLAVYVVDAVLLPSHLRQLLDGGDELGWLHHFTPTILVAVTNLVGFLIPED